MSNRIANLCRRNISNTVVSLQRKKKFTKAQVGFENLEKHCQGQTRFVTGYDRDLRVVQIEAISFLKTMSERLGSDIQQLRN